MNKKGLMRLFVASVFVISVCLPALAQQRFRGTVTAVVDGKTVIIEPKRGVKITFELRNIEVPEPEQQLHQVVKDHLANLALNKYVEFVTDGFLEELTYGRVFVNGVDLSEQLLRDGAAWFKHASDDAPETSVTRNYRANEQQARLEKRGVWSIEGMKPAWEFRAQKAEEAKLAEIKRKKIAELAQKKKEAAKIKKRSPDPSSSPKREKSVSGSVPVRDS